MALGVCGKKEMIFSGLGVANGNPANKKLIKLMAENKALQNAYDRAFVWIDSIKCSKTCSAKTFSISYISISGNENHPLPGGLYIYTSIVEIKAIVNCKDLISIRVKKFVNL